MKYIKKLWKNNSFVISSFLIWRVLLFVSSIVAINFVPRFSNNFFGGKLANYQTNPLLWGLANFDGEHYLSIAINGYKDLQQSFFPIYPFLIKTFSIFFGKTLFSYLLSGIFISNILFLLSLIVFWKLIRLDYSEKVAKLSAIAFLVFPTSFYFSTTYTESTFLFLTILSFYFFKKEKYLWVGIFGMLASATRVVGIVLLPVFLVELLLKNKFSIKKHLSLFLIPFGIVGYMIYSKLFWGDFLQFFHNATAFGEQRSDHLITLPQVFYRYFFKIIPNLDWSFPPAVFTTFLEVIVAISFLFLFIFMFKKVPWSYYFYIILIYLIPTLSGSFSSLPRYVLVAFPVFPFLASKLIKVNKSLVVLIFVILAIMLVIAHALFVRGYFVS